MTESIEYIANRLIPSVRAHFPDGIISIDTATDSLMLTVSGKMIVLFTRENLDDNYWQHPNGRLEEIEIYWKGLGLLGLVGNHGEALPVAPMSKEYATEVSEVCKQAVKAPPEWFKRLCVEYANRKPFAP